MSLVAERKQAIDASLERIRKIEQDDGVTEQSLEAIKGVLIELAQRRELFDDKAFPPPDRDGHRNAERSRLRAGLRAPPPSEGPGAGFLAGRESDRGATRSGVAEAVYQMQR